MSPFTTKNMLAIMQKKPVNGTGLLGCMGRHHVTMFVVPLPFDDEEDLFSAWNMTQSLVVCG